jgi:hypothetical protein
MQPLFATVCSCCCCCCQCEQQLSEFTFQGVPPVLLCSVDMVQCAGFDGSPCSLNEDLVSAVQVLTSAMKQWGVMPTLDFVRGGRTGVYSGLGSVEWSGPATAGRVLQWVV